MPDFRGLGQDPPPESLLWTGQAGSLLATSRCGNVPAWAIVRPTGHGPAAGQGHPKACPELQVTGSAEETKAAVIGLQRYQIDRVADTSFASKLSLLFIQEPTEPTLVYTRILPRRVNIQVCHFPFPPNFQNHCCLFMQPFRLLDL